MSPSTETRRDVPAHEAPAASNNAASPPRKSGGIRTWLRVGFSTLLFIGILAGIAAWGHSTDWTLPKFSALFSGKSGETPGACVVDGEGWCKEHNVPEAICIECNKTLVPQLPDYGW